LNAPTFARQIKGQWLESSVLHGGAHRSNNQCGYLICLPVGKADGEAG